MMKKPFGRVSAGIVAIVAFAPAPHARLLAQPAPGPAVASAAADEHGREIYVAHCAVCHGSSLEGGEFGPALKGAVFAGKWAARRPELLHFTSTKMPPAGPGSLSRGDYQEIIQYVSRGNGWTDTASGAPGIAATQPDHQPPVAAEPPDKTARRLGVLPSEPQVFGSDAVVAKATALRKHLIDAVTPVTQETLRSPSDSDWLSWRRTQDNSSFSPLKQIHRGNVHRLSVAWAWSLPIGPNEITPLVHDGIMFVTSANEVQALDATDGTLLWRYTRELEPQYRSTLNALHRSFAIYGDNLYVATGDRHVLALQARTGRVVWDHEVVPVNVPGMLLTSGPFVAHGKILQGTSIGAYCRGGCFVVGLDADTGRELWRFHTVAQPGQPGGDTWNGARADERYGGAVWVPGSYDPELNLVYFGTGQTYETGTLLRSRDENPDLKNDGLYTDSTIALNPDTGELAWYHQHLSRDVWDLDEVFERSLIDLPVGGKMRKLLVTTGKLGIMDGLDRAQGSYVFSKDFGRNNLVIGIDPHTGKRTIDPALTPQANKPLEVCPSVEGVRNWMTTAYNPKTRVMYLPLEETCMDLVWQPSSSLDPAKHGIDIGWSLKPTPHSDGNFGRLEAVDLMTRKTLWSRPNRAPLSSSLLATNGGVVFNGSRDRMFRASDDRSGAALWQIRLNAVPSSSPITYRVNGKQFVAIVAGGGGPHDSESLEITPEIEDGTATMTLWVFSLPDAPLHAPARSSHVQGLAPQPRSQE